jgi:hypothetical protein
MSTVRTGPCPTKGTLRSRISFRPPPIKVLEMALGRHASPLGGKPAYRTLAPNGEPGDRSRELAGRAPRGRRFSNFGKGYRPEIPAASDHLFRLDIGRATRRVTRWLSATPAAPPSGRHAPVGAGMPDRDAGFWNSFRGRNGHGPVVGRMGISRQESTILCAEGSLTVIQVNPARAGNRPTCSLGGGVCRGVQWD